MCKLKTKLLAAVFAIRKFHKYLYAREFVIYSDHLPFLGLFGHTEAILALASARIQRWMLLLSAYRYQWVYRRGSDAVNADALSRLSLPNVNDTSDYVHFFSVVNDLPLSADKMSSATRKDNVLKKDVLFTLNGWPSHVSEEELAPYFICRAEYQFNKIVSHGGTELLHLSHCVRKCLRYFTGAHE